MDTLSVGCVRESWQGVKPFGKAAFVQDAKKRKNVQAMTVIVSKLQFLGFFFFKVMEIKPATVPEFFKDTLLI